jgi:hypothetical protein
VPLPDQIAVQRGSGEQGLVVAEKRAGAVQDEHAARAEGGADPVRDDQQRARPGRERALGPAGRGRIQVTGRLVQDGRPGR